MTEPTVHTAQFTEETIQRIFGHEAAEDEDLTRLKQYYFKNKIYDKVRADLALRILVGHKGIGKSALFKVAMNEDRELQHLPILVRPNDIAGIDLTTENFLELIKHWKLGLQTIIAQKALDAMQIRPDEKLQAALTSAGNLLGAVRDTVQEKAPRIALQPAQKTLITKFLKKASVNVYIDDLDRGWQGKKEDIRQLSALVNALRDLSNENSGLRFKLSLRSDVYFLLRTSDESTDKLEGSVIWFAWTNHEILALLVKRIETYFDRTADEEKLLAKHQSFLANYLTPIMVSIFRGRGKWQSVPTYRILMSLIRKMPRDLVKLCSLAARHASDHKRTVIITDDLQAVFEEYSQGRIQDTINEFKSELPDISRLIMNMKPNRLERVTSAGYVYKTETLLQKLRNITQSGRFIFHNGAEASPQDLAQFLYKINFLTARKVLSDGEINRKYFEENRYLSSAFTDYGYDWEVHPAYRWALQPDRMDDIYDQLLLDAGDLEPVSQPAK